MAFEASEPRGCCEAGEAAPDNGNANVGRQRMNFRLETDLPGRLPPGKGRLTAPTD